MTLLNKLGLMPLILSVSISLELPIINLQFNYQSKTTVVEHIDNGSTSTYTQENTSVFFNVSTAEVNKG